MAKNTSLFFCTACGSEYRQWEGRCRNCGQWNSLKAAPTAVAMPHMKPGGSQARNTSSENTDIFTPLENVSALQTLRMATKIGEFDRTIGGGIVPGGVTLISGDPGIGKSTLLLQIAACLSQNKKCAYISGEESTQQIYLRAERLEIDKKNLHIANAHDCEVIIAALDKLSPDFAIIDSIQTLSSIYAQGNAGSVTQIRIITQNLVHYAKAKNCALMIVGHVTKEGTIAGPRLLEHMVDTVLYLEGDKHQHYRLLRTIKNRFGATDEVGVFDITETGLQEVPNPSYLFTSKNKSPVPGKAVFAGTSGSRPLLIDIQALVTSSIYPMPKRTAVGFDPTRLDMILAILENRAGYVFAGHDIYINIAGGLKVREPACDLAMAVALVSALLNRPLRDDIAFAGELSLSGEVRPINLPDLRIREAKNLGFSRLVLPYSFLQKKPSQAKTDKMITIIESINELSNLMQELT